MTNQELKRIESIKAKIAEYEAKPASYFEVPVNDFTRQIKGLPKTAEENKKYHLDMLKASI